MGCSWQRSWQPRRSSSSTLVLREKSFYSSAETPPQRHSLICIAVIRNPACVRMCVHVQACACRLCVRACPHPCDMCCHMSDSCVLPTGIVVKMRLLGPNRPPTHCHFCCLSLSLSHTLVYAMHLKKKGVTPSKKNLHLTLTSAGEAVLEKSDGWK